jgi:acetyl esterase
MSPTADVLARVEAMRAGSVARAVARPRGPQLTQVRDETGPGGLRLRRYRPAAGPCPLVVLAHGGGWFLGDLETHDRTCRRLAAAADVEVLAVDYRRAPETTYPGAIEDVAEVIRWARPDGVVGDSAGGYLVTAACLRLRDAGEPMPSLQVLVCPNTDLTLSSPSITDKGTGYSLDAEFLDLAVDLWTPDATDRVPGSPLLADDLSGLPAAVVVTAENDPLRDEGDAYARRLAEAGVPVTHRCEPGLEHGFIQDGDLVSTEAGAAGDRLFADVRALLAR